MAKLLCLGTGYTARRLADRMLGDGWTVVGTTRSNESAERLRSACIEPVRFDTQTPGHRLDRAMSDVTHIVVSVPPEVGPDSDDRARDVLLPLMAATPTLEWVGYLSTIGVYGNHDGGWVDETTDPAPVARRSIARLAAERAWSTAADGASWRLQIFRLAGIYGPGRSPIDRLRDGTARSIIKPGQVFNRIHVDDIVAALVAGMAGQGKDSIYNVTDDEPAPPQDVLAHAAQLIGRAPPPEIPFELADLTPMARSFYGENKRVRNARLRNDLAVSLKYPSYREGLASLL